MRQLTFFDQDKKFLSLKDASRWASTYLNKKVNPSNISYLIQYGKIKKYLSNGKVLIDINELKNYYDSFITTQKEIINNKLEEDLNWDLSFCEYKESERTKHVHRLHPYKGKFIPQLVEYFLDGHTDKYKKEVFFKKGDVILDPFCGSGTTLVQANELGIHAIGIDISSFNVMISNVKIEKYNIPELNEIISKLTLELENFQKRRENLVKFENYLSEELLKFNKKYFPTPEYKKKIKEGIINEIEYSKEKEKEFLEIYRKLLNKYKIDIKQNKEEKFLEKWIIKPIKDEIDFLYDKINKIKDKKIKDILSIILSRTVRSCRATTHSDLATLKKPVIEPYYCKKHSKICKPIFSLIKWWQRYSVDTLERLTQFDKIRTNTIQIAMVGDSRKIDIIKNLEEFSPQLTKIVKQKGISGIFSSPPYVGLINYHEQHAYAYEIFNLERRDDLEIGPLFRGQGKRARETYIKEIAKVLLNCKKFLKKDYNIFLVANDKYNLYPKIAELSNMRIVNQYKRPVLNRVEKNRMPYSEIIFHLREK